MTALTDTKYIRFLRRAFLHQTRQQIVDYTTAIRALIWQRQGIFAAATVLAVAYINAPKALLCYSIVLLTELLDLRLARRVANWEGTGAKQARAFSIQILLNTALSATAITLFVLMVALEQRSGDHFAPLFFLFAAALFCAMNNHNIIGALVIRLAIYAVGFTTIALIDVVRYMPPITSPIWLQFFTVVFVMYFILDVSRLFLGMYRENQAYITKLEAEHAKTMSAFKVKSNFVSTVSHELRTPLTSIKGSLDLIASGALGTFPKELAPVLDLAGRNCKRLSDLINDILDVQSMEAGHFLSDLKPLCLEELIEDAVQMNHGFADTHGVYLDYVNPGTRTFISADSRRMTQVMTNLISNAVKFSDHGETVTLRCEQADTKVVVFVEDNGIGIPEGSQDKVFGQFSQVDSSDERDVGGTGLGMNITKQIVELHKGVIDYFSELGVGTTFMVAFDRIPEPSKDAVAEKPNKAKVVKPRPVTPRHAKAAGTRKAASASRPPKDPAPWNDPDTIPMPSVGQI
ncbi:HAMP domain-containing sensor histidine kinase [Pseudooceanicola sp.]|uniref:sensor histidine kinase n=1 Tax=Pseudooceanicola sp. TaxID=1914328 RepID=UPI00263286E8|nr:HAMP domain-containing sensor histidine kinase [Pseudooceanicola sp.]MDF1853976.1 HAMP domain-containing sensor histidine kinase [Pseudooceanicola sp.]